MAKFLKVKEWETYQHYKDRNPSWIKLHKRLLDDYDFHRLPVASQALAPMLWLLASESKDVSTGLIELDFERIGFRLRKEPSEIEKAINPLISGGFVSVYDDASGVLAETAQQSIPEKRREETYTPEKEEIPQDFNHQDVSVMVAQQIGVAGKHFRVAIEEQLKTFSVGTPLRVASERMIDAAVKFKQLGGTEVYFWLCEGGWSRDESTWKIPGRTGSKQQDRARHNYESLVRASEAVDARAVISDGGERESGTGRTPEPRVLEGVRKATSSGD